MKIRLSKCIVWYERLGIILLCIVLAACSAVSANTSEADTVVPNSQEIPSETSDGEIPVFSLDSHLLSIDLGEEKEIYIVEDEKLEINRYLGKWEGNRYFLLFVPDPKHPERYGQAGGYPAIGVSEISETGGTISILKELPDHGITDWIGPNLINGKIYLSNSRGITEFSTNGTSRSIIADKEGFVLYHGSNRSFLYSYTLQESETHLTRVLEGCAPDTGKTTVYGRFSYEYDDRDQFYSGPLVNTAGAITEEGFCYAVSDLQNAYLSDANSSPTTVYYQLFSGGEPLELLQLNHTLRFVFGDENQLLTGRAGEGRPAASAYSIQQMQTTRMDLPPEAPALFHNMIRVGSLWCFSGGGGLFAVNFEEKSLFSYQGVNAPSGFSSAAAYWTYDGDACIYNTDMRSILFFGNKASTSDFFPESPTADTDW